MRLINDHLILGLQSEDFRLTHIRWEAILTKVQNRYSYILYAVFPVTV